MNHRKTTCTIGVLTLLALGSIPARGAPQVVSNSDEIKITRKDLIGASRAGQDPAIEAEVKAAAAKRTPRGRDGHPDLNGYWAVPGSLSNPFGGGSAGPQAAIQNGGKVRTAVFGVLPGEKITRPQVTPNPPPYTPEAAAKRAELAKEPAHNDPTPDNCLRGGIPRMGPPNQILDMQG